MIIRLTNSKSEIVFKPHPGPEVDLRVPSIEKAMTLLGYRPTVSLEAGVSQAIAWYAKHLDAVAGKKQSAMVNASRRHRRVRIHRPQRAAARAARLEDRMPSITAPPGLEAFVAQHGLTHVTSGALRSAEANRRAGAGARRSAARRTRCSTSPPTAIRRRRPSGRAGISSRTRSRSSPSSSTVPAEHVVYLSSGAVYDGLIGAVSPATAGVAAAAVRDLEARVRAVPPVLCRAARHVSELRQRALLRRLRPVRAGAQDHHAVAAGAGGRPARVRRSRRRPEPDRLHVRGRCGGWVPGAGEGARHDGDGRLRVGRAGQRQRRRAGDGRDARRRRRRSATRATCPSTSSSDSVDTAMRERFGVVPSISFDDGLTRLHGSFSSGATWRHANPGR